MQNLQYENFEMASYLKSPYFNSRDISLLLALRTRTVRGIRSDFGGLYPDKMCPLSCGDLDTLPNLLKCKVLSKYHSTQETSTNSSIKYEDIFSKDIIKQKQVTELYRQLIEIRNTILNSSPVTQTGPMHSMQALQKLTML